MPKLNVSESLKEVARETPTASTVFHAMALKQRSRGQIDLGRFKQLVRSQGGVIDDADFVRVFERLDKLGIGHIIRSSRGNPKVFKWNYSITSVGKTAIEQGEPVKQVTPRRKPLPILSKTEVTAASRNLAKSLMQASKDLYEPRKPLQADKVEIDLKGITFRMSYDMLPDLIKKLI